MSKDEIGQYGKYKNDGGPAFPSIDERGISKPGAVTLLDYFAAKAMQGLMKIHIPGGHINNPEKLAKESFEMARAMLKAREGS